MTITNEFKLGSAEFIMRDKGAFGESGSIFTSDKRRFPDGLNSVTLFLKTPGDMFAHGRIGSVQVTAKKAAENVSGISRCVVHGRKITLYSNHIRCYADGVDVATDFVNAFNEMHNKLIAAAEETRASQ